MKNYIYKTTGLLAFIIIILACSKDDVQIINSFDFSVEETYNETAIINFPQKTSFKLTPNKIVTTDLFSFKYEIIDGDGRFQYKNEELIPENEFVVLDTLDFDLYYVGEKINTDNVRITFKNKSSEKTIDLKYNVDHNPFTIEASTSLDQVNVNDLRPISISLFNTGEDDSITYETSFLIIQGAGEVLNENGNENIRLDNFTPSEEGTFQYNLKFSEVGESKFVVSARDSNGQVKKDTLTFNVDIVDFAFTAASEQNTVFVGETVNLNFNITEDNGNGGAYQMRYEINQGDIEITSQGSPITAGNLINVPLGNFSWQAKGRIEEVVNITFFVKNESGVEVSEIMSINIKSGNFSFDAIPTENETNINESIDINSIIDENGPTGSPYSLVYSSSGTGFIIYNGVSYAPGEIIENIYNLTFGLEYKGLSGGDHTINFTVNNSKGVTANDQETLSFKETEYSFTAAVDKKEIFLGSSTKLNFNIDESGSAGATYKMSYEILNGSGVLSSNGTTFSPGTLYDVNTGNFQWSFKSNLVGETIIRFTTKNSTGVEISRDVSIVVVEGTFTFDAINTQNTASVEEEVTVNFIIEEMGPSASPYSLVFSSTGTGIVTYKGATYSAGQPISNIDDLNFSLTYKGLNDGAHTITYSMTSSNGTSFSEQETITFSKTNFSFSAESVTNEAFINECSNINFILSTQGTETLTYNMIYTSSVPGSFTYNDVSYPTNTPIVITPGSFTGCFTATAKGDANLNFTVRASNDVNQTDELNILIKGFTYSLSIPESISVNAGKTANFDFIYSASDTEVNGKVFYNIDDENGKLRKQSNSEALESPYTLPQGNTFLTFDYTEKKNYTINWTYINNLGYEDNYQTKVIINHLDYSLNINGSSDVNFGDNAIIDLSLISNDPGTQIYSLLNYSLSDSNMALINDSDGSSVTSNQIINEGNNRFIAKNYTGSSFTVDLDIIDEYGQIKSISRNYNIVSINIDFEGSNVTGPTFVNCGTQAGEQKQYKVFRRPINLINNSDATINAVQIFNESGTIVGDITPTILPGTESLIYTGSCQTECLIGGGSAVCEPDSLFKIRYKVGNIWSPIEDVSF